MTRIIMFVMFGLALTISTASVATAKPLGIYICESIHYLEAKRSGELNRYKSERFRMTWAIAQNDGGKEIIWIHEQPNLMMEKSLFFVDKEDDQERVEGSEAIKFRSANEFLTIQSVGMFDPDRGALYLNFSALMFDSTVSVVATCERERSN